MGKSRDAKKNVKKKAKSTMKERHQAKQDNRDQREAAVQRTLPA